MSTLMTNSSISNLVIIEFAPCFINLASIILLIANMRKYYYTDSYKKNIYYIFNLLYALNRLAHIVKVIKYFSDNQNILFYECG